MAFKIRRIGGAQAQQAAAIGLIKIDRASAKRLYDAGLPITMAGDKVGAHAFFGHWSLAHTVHPASDWDKYRGQFDVLANSFNSYLDAELGRRPAFFVARNDLARAVHATRRARGPHGTGHQIGDRRRKR